MGAQGRGGRQGPRKDSATCAPVCPCTVPMRHYTILYRAVCAHTTTYCAMQCAHTLHHTVPCSVCIQYTAHLMQSITGASCSELLVLTRSKIRWLVCYQHPPPHADCPDTRHKTQDTSPGRARTIATYIYIPMMTARC